MVEEVCAAGMEALPELLRLRLEQLGAEYRWLPRSALCLLALSAALPDDDHSAWTLASGYFVLSPPMLWLAASWLALAWCTHRYDLTLQATQKLAGASGRPVGADFRFESREVRAAYARWRARKWRALDWFSLGVACTGELKLCLTEQCSGWHLLWGALPIAVMLCRVLCAGRLTCAGYSVPGLAAMVHVLAGSAVMALRGDNCFFNMHERDPFSGFASGTVFASFLTCSTLFMFPVSQPYVLPRAAITIVVQTASAYLHILFTGTAVDFGRDAGGWGLMCVLGSVMVASGAVMLISTELSHACMREFLDGPGRAVS